MVGRSISSFFPDPLAGTEVGEPRLELRDAGNGYVDGIDLTLRAGEIVGVSGLQGSGRTELLEAVFGVRPLTRGEMLLDGKPRAPALAARRDPRRPGADHRGPQGHRPRAQPDDPRQRARRGPRVFPRRTRPARREVPGLLSSLDVSARAMDQEVAVPLRRQPAEGRPRPLAGHQPPRRADGRADPRHRRRRQARDLRADARPGRRGRRRADGLQRAARGDRHVRPDPGDARRPARRRAARRLRPRRPSSSWPPASTARRRSREPTGR